MSRSFINNLFCCCVCMLNSNCCGHCIEFLYFWYKQSSVGSNVTDEEIRVAEEKFEESKELTETAMNNLLENEVEQMAQLQRHDAASRPKREHVPKRVSSHYYESPNEFESSNSGSYSFNNTSPHMSKPTKQPCAEALYDFDPENEGELGFKEGDIVNLISQIDENWFEGSVNGQTGYFPINYVKVVVDLPH
ncbi:hypothetical protein KUTeg_022587 [Tegillarca granosa]|uniref:SH3 domain-containing protein n=1 Tax=Tegillarca granosa TaxID=220873 RepID=A0ABQ9E3X6_TEGGR|nr:hypothetical protein KUTeg_022587 [Tegillarca granosa]